MSKINLLAKEGDLPGNPFCQFSFPRLELLTEVLVLRGGGEKKNVQGGVDVRRKEEKMWAKWFGREGG